MRGINSLRFNQATVNEALQEYLDKRTIGLNVTVLCVTEMSTGHFEVKIESPETDPA